MFQITPTFVLRVIQSRWKTSLLASFVAAVVVSLFGVYFPSIYTATSSVLVDMRADLVSGAQTNASPSLFATEVEVVKSQRVLTKVIDSLKLDDHPSLKSQFLHTFSTVGFKRWVRLLIQKNLAVDVSLGASVMKISFTNPDAELSAAVANAFAAAFVETSLALRIERAEKYSEFFNERAKAMRENVEKAQGKLTAFQKTVDVLPIGEKQDLEVVKLNQLEEQLLRTQASLHDSMSRAVLVQNSSEPIGNSPVIASIRQELMRKESQFAELKSRYDDNHPQVLEVRGALTTLKDKLANELARAAASQGESKSIGKRREAELRKAIEQQREKVFVKGVSKNGLSSLQKEIEAEQRAYDYVQHRSSQATLERHNNLPTATLLSRAEIPDESKKDILIRSYWKILFLAFGAFGIAAAFLQEFFDRRVYSAEDISAYIGLPIIGTLPSPYKSIWGRPELPSAQQSRLLRRIPSLTQN
jgi:polysaccharide biosynthesis transport protein